MLRSIVCACVVAGLLCSGVASSTAAQAITAVRVSGPPLKLDGRIDDAAWSAAEGAGDFIQREPLEGEPARNRTIVRFAYDDEALWVAARMFSTDPAGVRSLLSRHDRDNGSEQLIVSLDTNHDRRTAYNFAVTSAGVRLDFIHRSDAADDTTYSYDPVWEAAVRHDSSGWTAELRIPFAQLRFTGEHRQTWGVNIVRRVPAQDEWSFWKLVPRIEAAWSSRMGVLNGIEGVRAGGRIEVRPFVVADARIANLPPTLDPFADSRKADTRAGGDVKIGLGSNFTLDAAINPDFGQIDADPAVVNLTAFETVFDERRPFFVEGAELLDVRGLYYSRRVGAPPPGRPVATFAETRDHSTILGAAKLTGRTGRGMSLGALTAVSDRERVRTYQSSTGTYGVSDVAPRSSFSVVRARQEVGATGSTIGGFVSLVHRDLAEGSTLALELPRTAASALVDAEWRWGDGRYSLSGYAGGAGIRGDSVAILRQQRSSRRYWQRPDAETVRLDSSRQALSGTLSGLQYQKLSGRPWRWSISYDQASPGLEANDAGAISAVDFRALSYGLAYREPRSGGALRLWEIAASHDVEWNFDGVRRLSRVSKYLDVTLPDFTRLSLVGDWYLRGMSDRLTRGGPLMGTGQRWELQFNVNNRSGARSRWGIELETGRGELGNWNEEVEGSIALRPGTQWEVTVEPNWTNAIDPRQYVGTFSGGRSETYGRRYVFASIHRREISLALRLNYTFTPRLSLESYVEPFASSGRYSQLGELVAPKSRNLREYGIESGTSIVRGDDGGFSVTDGATSFDIPPLDFNVRALRSNLVLRWEWRLGSTAYLVWQQDREGSESFDGVQPTDVWGAFRARGAHSIALKVSYWLAR